jgi:hypothetical protein
MNWNKNSARFEQASIYSILANVNLHEQVRTVQYFFLVAEYSKVDRPHPLPS